MFLILYALVGAAIGSFLNVVIDRVPLHQSLLRPASHCPSCGRALVALDMVPVLSYVGLRGRCRTCDASIPLRVVVVEASTAALFGVLWWLYGPTLELAVYTVFACILLVIMVIDLETKLVPNVIILPATVLALLLVPLRALIMEPPFGHYAILLPVLYHRGIVHLSMGQISIMSQLLGGVTAFLIFFIIWFVAPQGMGAGDVKLAFFIGLVTAFPGNLIAVFGSFILGGVIGAALLISGAAGRKTTIPFAPFMVVTTFVVMLFGDPILHAYLGF
jgi:leader peptidase (prepilin peptidase)/N-methyltransferase